MRSLYILLKKELKQFFCSPFGWIVFTIITLLQGLSLSSVVELYQNAPVKTNLLHDSLLSTPIFFFYFLFLFPLITMKLFSEEERSGTLETMMTAPIRTWHLLSAKYLASVIFYCFLWLPLILHVKFFTWFTNTPAPASIEQFIGVYSILFLIGLFFIAVGCLASALTESQIIAAILTFGFLLAHVFLGFVPQIMGSSFAGAGGAAFFDYFAIQKQISNFGIGLLDSRTFIYYTSMALFTLLLTHHIVDYRRWKH